MRVIWSTQPTKSFWDLQPRLSEGGSEVVVRAEDVASDDLKTRLVARPAGPTRPLRAPRDPTVVVGAVELVKAGIPNLGGQPFSASESGVNLYDIPPGRRVTSRASFDHCSRPSCRFEDLESAVRSPPSASSLRPPRGNYDAHLPHILARSPSDLVARGLRRRRRPEYRYQPPV